VKWTSFGTAEPLATAFSTLGMHWVAGIISLGRSSRPRRCWCIPAGQPRIFFLHGARRLLPAWASKWHRSTYAARDHHPDGAVVATFATFLNINEVVDWTNIGTLFAFVLGGHRRRRAAANNPTGPRPVPDALVPWVPLFAVIMCSYLMVQLPESVGALRHLAGHRPAHLLVYGMRHSILQKRLAAPACGLPRP